MDILKEISRITENILSEDQFLVEAEMRGAESNPKVVLLIDSDSGMTIDACARLSRNVANEIEESDLFDSKYVLEVSSPGIGTPLTNRRQYIKNIKRKIRVKTIHEEELEGELMTVEEDFIMIRKKIKYKGKKSETEETKVSFGDIVVTKVLVSFNK
jgi:ribosome maturation factor RimP